MHGHGTRVGRARRWGWRTAVLAALAGAAVGPSAFTSRAAADTTPTGRETAPQNLLGNGDFETPAITESFRTMAPGSRLGTCKAITGAPVPGGCWTVAATDDVDIARLFWTPYSGRQTLDLSGVQGSFGRISQAFKPVAGHSLYGIVYAFFSCSCAVPAPRMNVTVVWGNASRVFSGGYHRMMSGDGIRDHWFEMFKEASYKPAGATWGMITFQDLNGVGISFGLDRVQILPK